MAKMLMKGNEAICYAAIEAGCKTFFGYPITPQNEIPEYMAKHLPQVGGTYLQSESEVSAINMIYGGGATGTRLMTSSSSPGIALKQEGISAITGAQIPCLIVSVSRGGPGLGGIQPSQADYYQATRGGGNGDYNHLVYTPMNVQEMADLTQKAFYVADKYRTPVMMLLDGVLGQMMEPVEIEGNKYPETFDHSDWALDGKYSDRKVKHTVDSFSLDSETLEQHNLMLQAKWEKIKENEAMYETYNMENAEIALVAYGISSRICKQATALLQEKGIKAGLIRPITVWPFPQEPFKNLPQSVKAVLVAELSLGQMIDDVKIAVNGKVPVEFYGRCGGMIFEANEIVQKVEEILKEAK